MDSGTVTRPALPADVSSLDGLRARNPDLDIRSVFDPEFGPYGRVHHLESARGLGPDAAVLVAARRRFSTADEIAYVASDDELEWCPEVVELRTLVFGDLDVQAGCCSGTNSLMKGMEFHASSEVVGAATDLVLMLGSRADIAADRWDSRRAVFVHVPAGTFVELYATTLHLAPARVGDGPFVAVIVLPRGTNTPLDGGPEGMLWMRNKWLLAHPDGPAAARGAWVGVDGPNWRLEP